MLKKANGESITVSLSKLSAADRRFLAKQKSEKASAGGITLGDDVSFAVPAGTTCAIVGASGSGKTTLLGLCAGLDEATAGHVTLAVANR